MNIWMFHLIVADTIVGGHTNQNGVLFYHVEACCGSLSCPPYENRHALSAVNKYQIVEAPLKTFGA